MKTFKFALAMLAASMMSTSELAMAATDQAVKKEYNKYLKEQLMADGANMNSFYQSNKDLMDGQSQAWVESWLETYGGDALPKVETQTITDKKGNDTIKLILSKAGATGTITISSENDDYFTMNGTRFHYLEATNLATIINRLAEKDSSLRPLAMEMNSNAKITPPAQNYLSIDQFMKMPALKKVEYLMLYRQVIEAAQRVNYTRYGAMNDTTENETYANGLHPLFTSLLANAAGAPANGTKCLIAGNISQYQGGSCAMPNSNFDKKCSSSGSGNVACNPLVYGFASPNGDPYCLDSKKQPDFTLRATEMCGQKSPIDPSNPAASYKKILSRYYMSQGGTEPIGSCFNDQSKVAETNSKCRGVFEPQLKEFKELQDTASAVCQNVTLPDQPDACASLKQRTLDLALFAQDQKPTILPVPVIVKSTSTTLGILPSDEQVNCEKDPKNKWDAENKKCIIPAVVTTTLKEVKPAKEKKKCEKGNKSFKCNAWLAIPIIGGIVALALLLKKKKKKKPPVGVPTTTIYSTPTTMPPSEGGDGTAPGSAGGVR